MRIRWLRVLGAVLAVSMLAGVAAVQAVRSLVLGQLRTALEKDLGEALAVDSKVGALEIGLWPLPHLEARELRITGRPVDGTADRIEVGRVGLRIDPWPLWHRRVVVDELDVEDVAIELHARSGGRPAVADAIRGLTEDPSDDPLDLHVRRLVVEQLQASRIGPEGERSLRIDRLDLEAGDSTQPLRLDVEGEAEGVAFRLAATGGSLAELLEPTAPFPVRVDGVVLGAEISIEGTLASPLALSGVDLTVRGDLPGLVVADWPLPPLGALVLRGRLSDLDGTLGFEQLSLSTTGDSAWEADVEGTLDDLLAMRQVQLDARLRAPSLDFLRAALGWPLSADSSVEASARLSDAGGQGLSGALHADLRDAGLSLDLSGDRTGPGGASPLDDLHVDFTARAPDLARLGALFEGAPVLPEVGPVELRGSLAFRGERLALEDLRLEAGRAPGLRAVVTGGIGDVLGRREIALSARFGAPGLAEFERRLGRRLPEVGAIEGSARLSDRDGSLGLERVELRTAAGGPVEIRVTGAFDDLFERDEITLDVTARARDLAALGAPFALDWPASGPVDLAARLSGSDEAIRGEALSLRIAESELRGVFSGSFVPDRRPTLRLQAESSRIRLADLGLQFGGETGDDAQRRRRAGREPLPFDWMRALDLDLTLRAERITGLAGFVRDADLSLRLENGDLVVREASGRYRRGAFLGRGRIDASGTVPRLSVQLDARGVDLSRLLSQLDGAAEATGLADVRVALEAEGETPDALRAHLGGRLRAAVRDGTAASQVARRFVLDLVSVAFPTLETRDRPRIGCAFVELSLADGEAVVQDFLLADQEVMVTGTGTVDLVRGALDLRLVPSSRRPTPLRVTPEVDVTGPIDDPKFSARGSTVVTSLGRSLASAIRNVGERVIRPFGARRDVVEVAQAACAQVGGSEPDLDAAWDSAE